MNGHLKRFLQRGIAFAGFGPIILGIVFLIIEKTVTDFSLTGYQVFIAILSTYILAFVQAGASMFNQIEEWPLTKSLLCHFSSLYVVYIVCYLINTWIPFELAAVLIFTGIFVAAYFAIWLIVYLSVRATTKKLNGKL